MALSCDNCCGSCSCIDTLEADEDQDDGDACGEDKDEEDEDEDEDEDEEDDDDGGTTDSLQPKANSAPLSIGPQVFQTMHCIAFLFICLYLYLYLY